MVDRKASKTPGAVLIRADIDELTGIRRKSADNLVSITDKILQKIAPVKCPEKQILHSSPDRITPIIEEGLVVDVGKLTYVISSSKEPTLMFCVGTKQTECVNCPINNPGIQLD